MLGFRYIEMRGHPFDLEKQTTYAGKKSITKSFQSNLIHGSVQIVKNITNCVRESKKKFLKGAEKHRRTERME